jgi:hypothetical protein
MAVEVPDSIHLIRNAAQGSQSCLIAQLPFAASTSIFKYTDHSVIHQSSVIHSALVSNVTIKLKQEANLHVARKYYDRPCKKILQEDIFSDPRVRLSVIGDSAMRCDSDRDSTLQSACVTLCKGLKPSQWLVED